MRFAAIADVHGNYLALEAVVADIRAQGVDDIVNLGDMASGPLDGRRTMDALMALDAAHVLGNHDRYLIDRPPEQMGSWDRPAHAQLDEAHLDWLRAVPPTPGYRDTHPYPHVIEAGTPDARYAILELVDGCWRVTFRHVPYDHEAMAALARQNGQPELASALATGWIT